MVTFLPPAASVVERIVSARRLPLARKVSPPASWRDLLRHPDYQRPPVEIAGTHVVLIGGLASPAVVLNPLQRWLRKAGATVHLADTRLGVGCSEETTNRIARQVAEIAAEHGERVVLVGHSRGGQFAKVIAARQPQDVAAVVTLGSPLRKLLAVHPLLMLQIGLLGLAGTVGVPGVMRFGCLGGRCCKQFTRDLTGAVADDVRFVSVYSRQDGVVDWRASQDPGAELREVRSGHSELLVALAAYRIVADVAAAAAPRSATVLQAFAAAA